MSTHATFRVEPAPELLTAARAWIEPVRLALGDDFLSAYLTGSVLTQGFDPKHSHVNLLVVARSLGVDALDSLHRAIPTTKKAPHFDPLFLTRVQIEKSLDVFPIEWLDLSERHMRIEGEDIFGALQIPRTYLRLQCEHELRGKHIQLRQAYLLSSGDPEQLARLLKSTASSFATLYRTLIRLRDESPPGEPAQVIERVSDLFGLDAPGLLGPHVLRYTGRNHTPGEVLAIFRGFLAQIDRLVIAIDQLRTE